MLWKDEEIEILKKLFPDRKSEDLVIILKRSLSSITNKANELNLKKSSRYKKIISKRLIKRNKKIGRDLNNKLLEEIALKYKSRSEFISNDPSAYSTARKKGKLFLDKICSHMIKQSFSIPQLILFFIIKSIFKNDIVYYNYRNLIKPYEIDIYIEDKLAIEYNGKRWHLNDKINKKKLCDQLNIDFLIVVENNRNYEVDIKEQLIKNINLINKYVNIESEEILKIKVDYNEVYKDILDINDIKEEIKKYKSITDLRNKNFRFYGKISKLDNYKELVKDIDNNNKSYDNNYIIGIIKKYNLLCDFIKNERKIYTYIKRNKIKELESELSKLKRKKSENITIDYCIKFINDFKIKTKYQLRKKNPSIYEWLKRNIGLNNINELLINDKDF